MQKQERLKSRKRIELLFSEGKSFSVFPYRVQYSLEQLKGMPETPLLQMGVSVGTRNFKRAVDRNRIKRLTREAYRLQKTALGEELVLKGMQLLLFIIYTGKEIPEFMLVKEKLEIILNKLIQRINEKNPPVT